MFILAIDTALGQESCAILKNSKVITFSQGTENSLQAERLFEHINKVLDEADLKYENIDYFAVDLGPGSFTGIRIGLSAALSICFASGKKMLGVSSLEALAYKAAYEHKLNKVYVALNAGRDEAYFQEFKLKDGIMENLSEGELAETRKILFADIGNIAECKIEALPDARDIGIAAYFMLKNKAADFDRKTPIYIRKPDVKINNKPIRKNVRKIN